ncbi:MAG: restriction endonuclease subunit S [Candidatus Cryptobacteroides sp.]|nr:restriction endonuclease subunit S [Candidatus Cryptobacteroides sp.]
MYETVTYSRPRHRSTRQSTLRNHNLEEQAQALYKSWFVDFEPFKDDKFVESELGMIPEGWRVGSIYEHVNVIYGAPYKSALFNENKNGFPLIRIRDLKDCKPQFYTPELLPNSEFVMSGDIVAGMDADFSPHLWKGETGLLNQRVCKFEPIDKTISNYYVLMLIKPELEFISSYKVGTTVSHLGKADIDRIRVILPPLKIVRDFSIISEQLLQMIIAHSSECRILRTQLNTLLPKLMSGELKINEIDC